MQPFVLHNLTARVVFYVCVYGWVAAELLFQLRNRKGRRRRFDWTALTTVISIWAGIGLALWLAYRSAEASFGRGWPLVILGLVAIVAGAGFRLWAMATLGRLFTLYVSIQRDHKVVGHGPYRFVRHPSYSGGLLGLLGMGICLENWLSIIVIALIPLLGLLLRIRVEERTLTEAFGDDYRDYAARRQRLLPGVW